MMSIGGKLSEILTEIETCILEHEVYSGEKPDYTIQGFRAATNIFTSVIMDRMWELQEEESLSREDRMKMAEKAGEEIRNFVRIYTNIDTFDLCK